MEDEPVALYPLELSVSDVDGDVLQMNVSTTLGGGSLLFEGQLPSSLDDSVVFVNMGHTLVMEGTPEVITEMLKNISFIPHEDFNGLEALLLTAVDNNLAFAEPREVMIYIVVRVSPTLIERDVFNHVRVRVGVRYRHQRVNLAGLLSRRVLIILKCLAYFFAPFRP